MWKTPPPSANRVNYEDRTPKSLPGSLSFITGLLQDSYQEITELL